MSMESKKSIAGSVMLMVLGILALCTGIRFLAILVPAAIFVYGTAASRSRKSRYEN
jgi:hypothetical protein